MDESNSPRSFLPLSFHVQFLPPSREWTVGFFAIDGRLMELPSLSLFLSAAFVAVVAAVHSFRHYRYCCLQLLSLLLFAVSITAAVVVRSAIATILN